MKIKECKTEDLIIKRKNNKCAIYDKRQEKFLTPFLYDKINLSNKYHIVWKCNCDTNGKIVDVYYSALIDNKGNVIQNDDYIFIIFDGVREDVCVVCTKNYKNCFLYNINKGIISNGYNQIIKACDDIPDFTDFWIGTIWEIDENKELIDKQSDLLYKDGTIVPFAMTFDYEYYTDNCLKLLERYGPEIIYFFNINRFVSFKFKKLDIIYSVLEYAERKNLVDKDLIKCLDKMIMCLSLHKKTLTKPLYDEDDFLCIKECLLKLKIKDENIKNNYIEKIKKTLTTFEK